MTGSENNTLYNLIGGAGTVRRLVEAFYPKVQVHPGLSPLFPSDISPVIEKQYLFLTQFFGGPTLYSDQYGHPMMRARHMHFPVTSKLADAWLACMKEAMQEIGLDDELQQLLIGRLQGTAYHFINTPQ
jgi:hemoglobin